MLKKVAQTLQQTAKHFEGIVVRWGGEEFLALVEPNSVDKLACEFVHQVAQLQIPHETSTVATTITISVGGARGVAMDIDALHALYQKTDEAMYQVKAHGRNDSFVFEALKEEA